MEETECRLQRVNIYISLDYVICNDNMYYRALKNGQKKKKANKTTGKYKDITIEE